ncbi:EAL domain-containing protein [Alkalilimnicola ehrlichii]|uniref:EAL domain-containing protein n=1 Tax=Alkalilimnicola ehrlichii TaxID=351052 RepID=UPI003BA137BC
MSHQLPVERIVQSSILHCGPETPLCQAAERMAERQCSSILVMEADRAVGIWTERDALAVDFSDPSAIRRPIREAMSSPVACIPGETELGEVAMRFRAERCRHFLVIDRGGQPLGLVSQTDVALNQGMEPYLRLREVGAAMRTAPLVLAADTRLSQAARRMRESERDAAVIRFADTDDLGIVTERDLVRCIARYPGDTPIGHLASRPLLTVAANDMLIRARDMLMDHQVRHLAVLDDRGQVVGLLGFQDLLAGAEQSYLKDLRRALEQRDKALAQSRKHLQLAERVIDSSLEGIVITDAHARIEFVNPAFTHLTGYSLEEVAGRTPAVLSSGRHPPSFYREMWQALQERGYWRGEIWNRRKSGALYLELLTITAITNDDGDTTHYAGLFTDITHIRENERQIRQLAYYDPLTRLPNRRLLDDRLSLAIKHAHRHRQRLAVMFIDLDHFKQVNDTLGHAVGDELLLRVSERLREHLREDDTLARLGGDEFLALLPDLQEVDEAIRVTQRLIEAISQPYTIGDHDFRVGCSIGLSLYPDDGESPDALIRNADGAMYRSKTEGRNTYRLYAPEMDTRAKNQLALETALRDTAETGEGLSIHYQPIFDWRTGALHSAEALLRWHHPTRGPVAPGEFIPLAERSGLIIPLGQAVMRMVCTQLKRWQAAGLRPVPVAINLSAKQFWQDELPGFIRKMLQRCDLNPGLMGFELTESTLMHDIERGLDTLAALRGMGCSVAIDDFGTGYSSLTYLQRLPVTTLKIDRSFVSDLGTCRKGGCAIVAAVTGLARELELQVVAEGVETEAQLRALDRYQVALVQGFKTGRPVPADAFSEAYLRAMTSGRDGD